MTPTTIAQLIAVAIVIMIAFWIAKKFAPEAQKRGKDVTAWVFWGSLSFFGTCTIITTILFVGSLLGLREFTETGLDEKKQSLIPLIAGYSLFLGLSGGLFVTRRVFKKLTGGESSAMPAQAEDLLKRK